MRDLSLQNRAWVDLGHGLSLADAAPWSISASFFCFHSNAWYSCTVFQSVFTLMAIQYDFSLLLLQAWCNENHTYFTMGFHMPVDCIVLALSGSWLSLVFWSWWLHPFALCLRFHMWHLCPFVSRSLCLSFSSLSLLMREIDFWRSCLVTVPLLQCPRWLRLQAGTAASGLLRWDEESHPGLARGLSLCEAVSSQCVKSHGWVSFTYKGMSHCI